MTTWTINGKAPESSFVFRSGLRMQVTPEGDCREATFMAKGAGLGLRPLDIVEIACDGQKLFVGELRVGGNPKDVNGHQHTVRSLALRLKEVAIPPNWTAPQQSAAVTIRSLIESVLPQLDGAFTIGTIAAEFDCRAIVNAHQQNPYALLEQIAQDGAAMGVDLRFGVNAKREFFCVSANKAAGTLPTSLLTGATRWEAPVAEAPCTAVLWYVAQKSDGSWLTHLSQSPEVAQYGVRVRAVSLSSDEGLWEVVPMTLSVSEGAAVDTFLTKDSDGIVVKSHDLQGAIPLLIDNKTLPEQYTVLRVALEEKQIADKLIVSTTMAKEAQKITLSGNEFGFVDSTSMTTASRQDTFAILGIGVDEYHLTQLDKINSGSDFTYIGPFNYAALALNIAARPDPEKWAANLWLTEMRPERIRTEVLDRMAQYYYNIPAVAAGDIEVRGIYPHTAGVMDGVPVAAYEYRISAGRGVCTGILLGQADDPSKAAQAELIKARDNRAVITALTAAGQR